MSDCIWNSKIVREASRLIGIFFLQRAFDQIANKFSYANDFLPMEGSPWRTLVLAVIGLILIFWSPSRSTLGL